MRSRKALLVVVPLVLLVAWVALAQPRRGRRPPAPPVEKTPAAAETEEEEEPAKPEPKRAAGDDDLGEPPPKLERADGGVPLSPLNPLPNEFPDAAGLPAPPEYDRLLGDIAALRSRVAALTTTLFKSKLRVLVETRGDEARISKLVVTLDDGVVYNAASGFSAEDEKLVYEHAVAPGHHLLGIELERYDARGREYKTYQNSKFSLVIPESKRVEASMIVEDDSDMAEDFKDDQDGEYDLRVRLRARVVE
jgi:hypothetical protein